jgi:hypothetical protein
MDGLPDAMFVIDVGHEKIAISEANKLGIPVVGVVDTNNDPSKIDYVIPGNDDAIRAVRLYIEGAADAILDGRQTAAAMAGGMPTSRDARRGARRGRARIRSGARSRPRPSRISPAAARLIAAPLRRHLRSNTTSNIKNSGVFHGHYSLPGQGAARAHRRRHDGVQEGTRRDRRRHRRGHRGHAQVRSGQGGEEGRAHRRRRRHRAAHRRRRRRGVMVEVNSETDFVAKDENFKAFADAVADAASPATPPMSRAARRSRCRGAPIPWTPPARLISKVGENVQLRRLVRFDDPGGPSCTAIATACVSASWSR